MIDIKKFKGYGLVVLFFVLLAAVVFRCGLGSDMVFSGSDANIGLAQRGRMLSPEKFSGAYVSAPLLGEAIKAPFSFSNIGQLLLSPQLFADTWYALCLIISSVALVAYLRLWKLNWLCCLVGAVSAFWVGSVTLSAGGHIYKLGMMAFFAVALYLVERAVRNKTRLGQIAYAILSGVSIGLMLLEQQDVGLLSGLFLGSYALFRLVEEGKRDWKRWLTVLVPIALVALPLAAPTALSAYSRNVTEVGMAEDPEYRWNFTTQWSMVPSEFPELIAPGYTGLSTGHPEFPYWGRCGQSAEWKETGQGFRNFRLDSLYIGVVPVFLAVLGFALAARRLKSKDGISSVYFFWGLMALLALLLSFGKFCPVYKVFHHLPLVGNIRGPVKFLHNFQVIIGILAAFGLNRVLFDRREGDEPVVRWSMWITAGVAVLMAVFAFAARLDFVQVRFADWGESAASICTGISHAWLHASVMALLVFLAMLLGRKKALSQGWLAGIPVILLGAVAFDSVYLTNRYFRADSFAAMKAGNPVINYLKQNQGVERVYCFSQQGVYNLWISYDFLFHDIQAFNFGQMPRMPNDYKAFLSNTGGDWHRFMQLTSSRYALAPAPIYVQITQQGGKIPPFIKPVSGFRFVQGKDHISTEWINQITHPSEQVLFECTDVPPRFALFPVWETVSDETALNMLGDPAFLPDQKLLLSDATSVPAVSPGGARQYEPVKLIKRNNIQMKVGVKSASGGILRFNQRYTETWRVLVDGEEQPLLKCNYITMGVYVPEGEHEIIFKCPRKPASFIMQTGVTVAGLLVPALLLFINRRRGQEINDEQF